MTLVGTAIPGGSGGFLIFNGPHVITMDPLIWYMVFFLACMAAIVLLTYLSDRGDKRSEETENQKTGEQGLDPLHQIED